MMRSEVSDAKLWYEAPERRKAIANQPRELRALFFVEPGSDRAPECFCMPRKLGTARVKFVTGWLHFCYGSGHRRKYNGVDSE